MGHPSQRVPKFNLDTKRSPRSLMSQPRIAGLNPMYGSIISDFSSILSGSRGDIWDEGGVIRMIDQVAELAWTREDGTIKISRKDVHQLKTDLDSLMDQSYLIFPVYCPAVEGIYGMKEE
jgi:hypothetical protein